MRKGIQHCLEHLQSSLTFISDFTDYDDLQEFEIEFFGIHRWYKIFFENERLFRNEAVIAIENQYETIKNFTQNSTEPLFERDEMQKTRVDKIKKAIEELKRKTREIKNENKEIENFQKEIQVEINQFRQQVAIKKQQLFKGLLPARIQQFEQFQADESHVGDQCAICMENMKSVET